MKYLKLLFYITKHKYYVFIGCFKKGLYWRGLVHDLDKLIPPMLILHSDYFDKKIKTNHFHYTNVMKHKRFFGHHWESWVFFDKNKNIFIIPMDNDSILEMVIDWESASRAKAVVGDFRRWYWINKNKILLHKKTRIKVEKLLKRWYNI